MKQSKLLFVLVVTCSVIVVIAILEGLYLLEWITIGILLIFLIAGVHIRNAELDREENEWLRTLHPLARDQYIDDKIEGELWDTYEKAPRSRGYYECLSEQYTKEYPNYKGRKE